MNPHFGLEISHSSLKVAEATVGKEGYELTAFGESALPASLQSENPADHETILQSIKLLVTNTKIRTREVYLSLPESLVYTRVISLPRISDQELQTAIKYEAEQYIPVPLEEVYVEYQKLDHATAPGAVDPTSSQMDVLLVAAKKRPVDRIKTIVEDAGLVPLVMETALLGSIRALAFQIKPQSLIVDMGEASTDVGLIYKGGLKQISSLATGGEAMTRALVQALGVSTQEAEQYRHQYGLDTTKMGGKIAGALEIPMRDIMLHIEKNIKFAQSINKDGKLDTIILGGSNALMPEIIPNLTKSLKIAVALADPLQSCLNKNLPKSFTSVAPRFTSVIGLAIRE